MSAADSPTTIGPQAYDRWRARSLGAITEALEHRLLFDLIGELKGKRLLDAGCGDGALVALAAARGADAIGVDPDPAMLAAARARADRDNVRATFLDGRVQRLPLPDASVDVVCSVTVLCFVADADAAVREMARVLRPAGLLVLGELGRWNSWAAVRRIRGWFGSTTWQTARFRSSGELRALVGRAGLAVTAVRGGIYYPPTAWAARLLAPFDPWLGRLSTWGAAFIALRAAKP